MSILKRMRALLLAGAVCIAAAASFQPAPALAKQFADVPANHWAQQTIDRVTDEHLMNGFANGLFGPDQNVTRSQVAAILANAEGVSGGESAQNTTGLSDVKSGTWYTASVNWAVSKGIFHGSGGRFRPDDAISREELAVALSNYADVRGMDKSYDADRMLRYSDRGKIDSWALSSVSWAVENGIMGSGSTVNPRAAATRAETAKMVLVFTDGGSKQAPILKSHFIDVGQGDSCLIELSNGQNMLIDAGTKDHGGDVVSYIRSRGISHLDYVVMSHPDADHIGGMQQVVETFSIGKIFAPRCGSTSKTWEMLLDTIAAKELTITEAKAGVNVVDTDGLSVRFVAPTHIVSGATNENSDIVWIDYGGKTFCFTGDADAADIAATAPGHADVLKVSHHGSSTGTSQALVSKLTPSAAVISVGANNSYGHPTASVLQLLANSDVYRTDQQGTITAYSDTSSVWFSTAPTANQPTPEPDPEPAPDPEPTPDPTPDPTPGLSTTVWVTKTGSKYHYSWCPTLSRSKNLRSMTAGSALSAGYAPCKVCNPPA